VTKDGDHPIVKHPWEYKLIEFCYRRPDNDRESYVDLVLQKGVREAKTSGFFAA
jgi:hypothetical protein